MEKLNEHDNIYKAYGKFLINFEHVTHLMRLGILYMLFPNPDERQENQNEILMESLTADQTRKKFLALVLLDYQPETELFKLSTSISLIYEILIPIRNSFAHGTAFIGISHKLKTLNNDEIALRHPKIKKNGLDLNYKTFNIETLDMFIKIFQELIQAILVVSIYIKKKSMNEIKNDEYDSERHMELNRNLIDDLRKKLNETLREK